MKKVGIFTIQSYNYGNRLQNYATQEVLKKLGYQPVTFRKEKLFSLKGIKKSIRNCVKNDRFTQFNKFDRNIKYSTDYINKTRLKIKPQKYYAILAGSDQIWNTKFDFVSLNYFLPFQHERKIGWSASFGGTNIPYDAEVVNCLHSFKALSVREDAGEAIIKDATGKNATVLVDPTMLLSADEWEKVAHKPKGVTDNPYILTYFLSPKCEQAKNLLNEWRGEKTVYELLTPDDEICTNAGPAEFLWLFRYTDLVLTDSFHACVFAFLFHKPFVVFDRNWEESNMNARLDTFLSKFDLKRKYANSGLENDIYEHDYQNGNLILEKERKKAYSFLKEKLQT